MTYVLEMVRDPAFALSQDIVKSLHFMMQSYDLDKWPGRYRPAEVFVLDEDNEVVVYYGPDADKVPGLMAALARYVCEPSTDTPVLVRAAMAHLNLVMIHPFKDGNGRMARCLQTLMLAREGVLAPEFCSIEEYLGRNERDYYEILAHTGKGRWSPRESAHAWVRFSLTAHYRQAMTVLRRSKLAEQLWLVCEREVQERSLPDRVTAAVFHVATGRSLRNSTYRQISGVTHNLASRDLRDMVKVGLLDAIGEKRGRTYTLAPKLRPVSLAIRRDVHRRFPVDADPYEVSVENEQQRFNILQDESDLQLF